MKECLRKQISLWTASALLMGGLTACGGGGEGAPAGSSGTPERESEIKIGILIPGSPTDGGFSQQATEAGALLEERFDCHVAVVEAATADAIKSEGETMAAEGYKIVFGHGGQCSTPLAEISQDYPDTWFVTTGGTEIRENQFHACLCLEQSTYVAGVIAGLMTKSNVIGCSVGGDFPAYTKTTNGFKLGAESVNPDVEVLFAVLSSTDTTEAYETTTNQIQMGADFIYSNTNEGQGGAIKAVEAILSGEMGEPEIMYLDMSNESVSSEWNEALKKEIPQEVLDKVDETIQAIADGAIHVPNEYELG